MKKYNFRINSSVFKLLGTTALIALLPINPAFAQSAESAESDDERNPFEIVVTAQKREQSLNDVGISITAANAEQLANAGVNDVSDLAKIVTGLTFTASLNNTPVLTLRGVGFNDYTLGASPTVSVYTDQVPMPFLPMTRGVTMDVERVEVLKGPQGILFGQNATGGAINYIAAKPTDSLEAGVNGSFGRFDEITAGGFISGPINDTLRARVAVKTLQYGDWQQNFTRDETRGSTDLLMGRALIEWEPSAVTKFTLNLNGWRDKSDTVGTQLRGFRLQQTGNPVADARGAIIQAQPLAPLNARAANWGTNNNLTRDDNYVQVSLRADFEMTDDISLTSITSWDRYREDYGFDRDGTVLRLLDVVQSVGKIEDYTQELRISGATDRLNWVIGGNLIHATANTLTNIGVGDSTNTAPFGFAFNTALQQADQVIDEYAAFGNVEYQVTDTITLLGGMRYTTSTRDFTGCTAGDAALSGLFTVISGVPLVAGDCVTLTPPPPAGTNRPTLVMNTLKEDNLSWKAGINFEPNSDTLLYASVTKGYKAGSFPVLSASGTRQLDPVGQESVLAYEAGFKLSLLDQKLQLNGAAFYYDYRNKQVRGRVVVPIFVNLEALVNVDKSRIAGGEIQILARPIEGLTFNASATYLDAKIQRFTDELGNNFAGNVIPYTPKWQATADLEYRFPVGDLEAYVGSNMTHNSSAQTTLGSPFGRGLKQFTVLDLRAGVESSDGSWNVGLYGRNVTNEYYWNNDFATQDVIVRYAAKPVTYGIKFGYRFR